MNQAPFQPRSDLAARLVGLVFLSAGAGIVYWQGYIPFAMAAADRPTIEYSVKLLILGIFGAIFGLLCVARGLAGYTWVVEIKNRPRAKKVLFAVSFVSALLLYWLIEHTLATYGYSR